MSKNATLGTTTKYASNQNENSRYQDTFKLLNASQRLLSVNNHRVCICCKIAVPDAETIDLVVSADGNTAGYRNTMKCGSVWACPVCASKISEQRRIELEQAVLEAKSRGWRVAMMTVTMSHNKKQTCLEVRELFQKSWRCLTSGRWWQTWKDSIQLEGTVRAIEVTYGDNGWHVHYHVLLFTQMDLDDDLDKYRGVVAIKWAKTLSKTGSFASLARGVDLTENQDRIADYIAKHGKMPASDGEWNESHEIAKSVAKKSKGKNGKTPFMLLSEYAESGNKQAGALFVEYVNAMKHQRQLVWSNGLKELLLVDDVEDEEIAEREPETLVAQIERNLWHEVCRVDITRGKVDLRGKLLDLACQRNTIEIGRILHECQNYLNHRIKYNHYKSIGTRIIHYTEGKYTI